jgi:hypothetical protein
MQPGTIVRDSVGSRKRYGTAPSIERHPGTGAPREMPGRRSPAAGHLHRLKLTAGRLRLFLWFAGGLDLVVPRLESRFGLLQRARHAAVRRRRRRGAWGPEVLTPWIDG